MKHLDVEDRARQSLRGIGFGEPVKIEALVGGRNDTFSVVLPNGETIFVKCLRGEESDMRARIARSLSFHQAWEVSSPVISTPALLGSSEEQGVLVHEWIDEAEGLGERSDENIFDETTAHACGVLLGELHAWQPPAGAVLDKALPPMPSAEHFNILPADAYTNASGAELQLFSMVQRDTELLGLFSELRRAEERSERKPVHGDVRLDQFLVAGKEIFLVDWEEFRIGDPARDVGAFLGEVIFRALLAVFMNEGLHDSVEDGAGLRSKILEVGAGEIESRSAFLGTFLEAYGAHHGVPGEEFRIRTVSYAGWHLLDRVIANARRSYHLPATMRGVAGIGRAALFAPTRYASSFGFKGEGA